MAKVLSVNTSEKKGTVKTPTASALLIENHGIEGDAHAGGWHRQISLLANESVDTMRAQCDIVLQYGVFGENVDTEGIELTSLPTGARLLIGECELELTQIGKECHSDCDIKKRVGKCVMPTDGVFARVIKGGRLKPGDDIAVL